MLIFVVTAVWTYGFMCLTCALILRKVNIWLSVLCGLVWFIALPTAVLWAAYKKVG